MKLGFIGCKVLWREISYFAAQSEHVVDYKFLPQGLHLEPDRLRKELQAAISEMDKEGYDYLILGYGLCSLGVAGIKAQGSPIVIPRAHDCLTFLLGSKERHLEVTTESPGVYYFSPGWIETGTQPGRERVERTYEYYLEKYGEDNAKYLMETLESWMKNYSKALYIDLGVGNRERNLAYTEKSANEMGWEMEVIKGDPTLIKNLVGGRWDEESFLVVPPGREIAATGDNDIMGLKE